MPYLIHDPRDVHAYRPADQSERGAFHVSDSLAACWGWECRNGHRPVNHANLPLRPFPAGEYHGEAVPEGIFVDWQHPTVREFVWTARHTTVAEQLTHPQIAATFGPFQHDLQSYRAADAWARRVDRAQARGGRPRDPRAADYRRYSNRTWSRQAIRATAGSAFRRFGIEIEWNYQGYDLGSARSSIATQARAAGIRGTQRWGYHVRDTSIAGWQYLYDCTVNGGEIVSDITDGSAAAHDEVRTMLRFVRDNGGYVGHDGTGQGSAREQGMHVHHDAADFDRADKLRLIDNLQNGYDAILAFLPASRRRTNRWCNRMGDFEWDAARGSVAAGRNVTIGRYYHFNLSHLMLPGGQARVEWRGLGNTLNGRKVRTWVRLGQAVMQATKAGETFAPGITPAALVAILRHHGLTQWAADQYLARCGSPVTV